MSVTQAWSLLLVRRVACPAAEVVLPRAHQLSTAATSGRRAHA